MNIFRLSGKLLIALTKYLSMVEPRTEQQATRNLNPLHASIIVTISCFFYLDWDLNLVGMEIITVFHVSYFD